MKRFLVLVAALAVLTLPLFAGGAKEAGSAKPVEIKVAHAMNEGGLYYIGAEKFKEIVDAGSNGRIKVTTYPSRQLGGDRDIQEGVQIGSIEAGISGSPLVLINDYYALVDAPYLFIDRRHVERFTDGPLGQRLAKPLEAEGLVHIGYIENGYRHITNNIRPIITPQDLAGIKMRVPESPVRLLTFRTYGSSPVPMSSAELFGALQQNIVDGQENPLSHIWEQSWHEVQKYISISGHVYSFGHLIMNKKVFDSLSADLQDLVKKAGREAAAHTRQVGEDNDNNMVSKFKDYGLRVDYVDKAAFVRASQPVWEKIVSENKFSDAKELLDQISALGK